jgi:hypothetical protein
MRTNPERAPGCQNMTGYSGFFHCYYHDIAEKSNQIKKKTGAPEGIAIHFVIDNKCLILDTVMLSVNSTLSLAIASRVHHFYNLQSRTRTHVALMICLYELLGNPTT